MAPKRKEICDCGVLEEMSENPKCPVEFDAKLNEYHIGDQGGGRRMVYYCPFCGGSTPKSRRNRLFHHVTDGELRRLCDLTKDIRTVQEVIASLGEPDIRYAIGEVITTPERDGKPEITQSYPVMIYTQLSKTADVRVTIYPTDKVGIGFLGKGIRENA